MTVQLPKTGNCEEGDTEMESISMRAELETKMKETVDRQNRRILRVLRSPKKQRQPLNEISTNTIRERKSRKRKGVIGEMGMVIDKDSMQNGKRNKIELNRTSIGMDTEGEGSNPKWIPLDN